MISICSAEHFRRFAAAMMIIMLGYGEATMIHLAVNSSTNAVKPWTLRFKTADVMVPLDLTITGIEPRKKQGCEIGCWLRLIPQ
jgi:hypothetical protein